MRIAAVVKTGFSFAKSVPKCEGDVAQAGNDRLHIGGYLRRHNGLMDYGFNFDNNSALSY